MPETKTNYLVTVDMSEMREQFVKMSIIGASQGLSKSKAAAQVLSLGIDSYLRENEFAVLRSMGVNVETLKKVREFEEAEKKAFDAEKPTKNR